MRTELYKWRETERVLFTAETGFPFWNYLILHQDSWYDTVWLKRQYAVESENAQLPVVLEKDSSAESGLQELTSQKKLFGESEKGRKILFIQLCVAFLGANSQPLVRFTPRNVPNFSAWNSEFNFDRQSALANCAIVKQIGPFFGHPNINGEGCHSIAAQIALLWRIKSKRESLLHLNARYYEIILTSVTDQSGRDCTCEGLSFSSINRLSPISQIIPRQINLIVCDPCASV